MKRARYLHIASIITVLSLCSCKKDVDEKIIGSYKGTVQYRIFRYPDLLYPIKDTLYTKVNIQVIESESSTRQTTSINFSFSENFAFVTSLNNIPIKDNKIEYYTSERGVAVSNQWSGYFISDSLHLNFQRDDHQVYVNEYTFKAQKQ